MPAVHERFRRLFQQIIGMQDAIWGLMRSSAVQRTHLIRPFIGADDCFLVEMVLQGTFVEVPEHLLLLRIHPHGFHAMGKDENWWTGQKKRRRWWHEGYSRRENIRQAKWFDPDNERSIYFPQWRRFREFSLLVLRSAASAPEKLHMLAFLGRLSIARRRALAAESWSALKFLVRPHRGAPSADPPYQPDNS